MTTMTERETRTIDAPGATLTYDIRPGGAAGQAPLLLIGSAISRIARS